ncbi:hypothetical protein EW026_g424 [Hermanssonia centrifuga]|uniref:Importin-7/11-like TPR repeats domain-containing protein n=1 Tax=Hermanssonia centrifuga TaxID=98765 RepID=A0A4S4KUT5_9APHY|nr:hypothetical protein EW026_g424 [Hermanssonia centrifuga]
MQLQNLSELRINLVLALRSGTVPAIPNTELTIKNLTRHIFLFGKFFRRLQQLDVARFVTLPISSDLILYYWNKVVQATNSPREYTEAVFPVRFLVQAMALFKDSLAQWAPVRKDGSENVQVLSQAFVEDAVRLLVTRFIPLDPSDLEEWMSDPEEWVNLEEKENEQWEYELRPCGERVLMTLAYQYRQYVIPLLLTTFEQIVAQPTVDLPSILQKEALYCAIGRCAQRMKEVIPFDQWLENSLISETRETNTGYPIIKRRIAWLIGKWISGQCSSPNNPKIWEVLVYLLQDRGPGTDAVVRLTAAVALRECVDSQPDIYLILSCRQSSFSSTFFAPYLPLAVTELVKLIAEADTLESKRRICNSLNTVIERSETQIVPLLGIVVEPLPQLWTAAGTDWLFKSALLETVTKLIESSKGHSAALSDFVVPLIRESFEPEARIQLDEDALMLWQVALRHTESLDGSDGRPGLASLIRLAVDLLANNLDLLGQIISILESYVILDASRVLQDQECTVDMFTAMEKAMNQAVQVNVKETATVLGLVVQLAPSNLWGEALHHSKLFAFLVKSIEEDKASTTLLTEYVLVLARIALVDRQMFLQLMSASAPALGFSEHRIWELTLDGWWTRFDNMSEPRHRKVAAMGIANLVATGHPEVLERLPSEICNMWLDVFAELREAQSSDRSNPSLFLYWDKAPDSFYHGSEGTAEYNRRKTIYNNDPARTIQLTSYIAARLQEAEAACGGSAALQAKYLAKADPAVLKEIHAELTGQNPGNSS